MQQIYQGALVVPLEQSRTLTCWLQVFGQSHDLLTVVVTEQDQAYDPCVTNAINQVARCLCWTFRRAHEDLVVILHYPSTMPSGPSPQRPAIFSRPIFGTRQGRFYTRQWIQLSRGTVETLLGHPYHAL